MYGDNEGRTRDERLMNAVSGLGGRSAANLEVDLALGCGPRPSRPASWPRWWRKIFKLAMTRRDPRRSTAKPFGVLARF